MKEPSAYTIRELSARYELPASTLRYYEDLGLLPRVEHLENGSRRYTDAHLERLDGILCFKRAGMSISQIQTFYEYEQNLAENIDAITALITDQETVMLQQLSDLEKSLAHLREKLTYYGTVKQALADGRPIPAWEEVIC